MGDLPTSNYADLRHSIVALARGLRQAGSTDHNGWNRLMTLGAIERLKSQATPTDIALELGMKSSNMAKILGELATESLIEKLSDTHDRRKTRLSLTEAGARLVAERRNQRDVWLAMAIETSLSRSEQEELLRLVPLLDKITRRKDPKK